jgi:prepilin-type N-terminal cleavage/methylation domain-containing protein
MTEGARTVFRRALRRPGGLARERGFTLIELLVAMTLVAVGAMALITTFDSSRSIVTTAERNEAAAHRAEQEMERILSLDYAAIALTSAPPSSGDPASPNYYVQPGNRYQWDQGATGPKTDDLVISVGGSLGGPTTWTDGQSRLSGSIHRFVTWVDDPCCAGTQDAKRVTVAVTVNGPGGPAKPVLISSLVTDPNAN